MGWNARMRSGIILRQADGLAFTETDLHSIEEMWLDGLEKLAINSRFCPGFVEFVYFATAVASDVVPEQVAEFIGWTDGDREYVIGISREKHVFHPQSRMK
ncbi:hypothetical protein ACFL67_03610 [candidate division KSB1 bacterium]